MSRAVLGLGSNLGDRLSYLNQVVRALGRHLVAASAVYETEPWGPVPQDRFLNAVIIADDPEAGPEQWWEFARQQEKAAHRQRDLRWGPRTLDVDVIQVRMEGHEIVQNDVELTLPHPRVHERAFVLIPWADVEPDAVVAGHGRIAELISALKPEDRRGVRRCVDLALELKK